MAETGTIEPKIAEFSLNATLTGDFQSIAQRFSTLQMFSIKITEDNSLVLLSIESRDMQKNPFLFFIITLKPDSINVQYSIALDTSEKMRKLYVIKNLLGVLSLITDLYYADQAGLYQYIDSTIDDLLASMSQNYSALFNNYDSLFNEYRELKRLNIELTNANKNLTVQATQAVAENRELKAKLESLETYSDESLMVMLEDWIDAHNNTIDLMEFSKSYKIPLPRIEQMLNKMVTTGYIELKG
ncbi:hypothetical protein M1583_02375 [Candidatus Marsarchaeota archaeon]|nr:hypothetical protein [Candidatus Marsarchaeota archaeon]